MRSPDPCMLSIKLYPCYDGWFRVDTDDTVWLHTYVCG